MQKYKISVWISEFSLDQYIQIAVLILVVIITNTWNVIWHKFMSISDDYLALVKYCQKVELLLNVVLILYRLQQYDFHNADEDHRSNKSVYINWRICRWLHLWENREYWSEFYHSCQTGQKSEKEKYIFHQNLKLQIY